MTKVIELTQGKEAIVDDEDFARLDCYLWQAALSKATYYAARRELGKIIYMHQVICPCEPGFEPHHKNSNGLDNRRDNLEPVTRSINNHLRRAWTNMPNIYPSHGKFKVRIRVNKKEIYAGSYRTLEMAEKIRDQLRERLGLPNV